MKEATNNPKPPVHVSVDGVELKEYLNDQTNTEIDKTLSREIAQKKVGIRPTITSKFKGNLSGTHSERCDYVKPVYTGEQIAHANYLLDSGPKESEKTKTMSTFSAFPNLLPSKELGSIESALNDAKGKERFYRAEMARNEYEATKWAAVASQLEQTLNIVTGKVVVSTEGGTKQQRLPKGPRVPRGTWENLLNEFCKTPCTKPELIDFMMSKGAPSRAAAYHAIDKQVVKGTITKVDGKYIS
jgi:hypothetical protein